MEINLKYSFVKNMDSKITDKSSLLVLPGRNISMVFLYAFAYFQLNVFSILFFLRQKQNQILQNKRLIGSGRK